MAKATNDNDPGEPPDGGARGRTYLAEVLEQENARLSDYRLVRRALNDGFPISDELKEMIQGEVLRVLTNPGTNTRARLACLRILMDAQRLNIELIKLGHKDQHQLEKERRQQSVAGKLPANDPDAPDSVTKQPTKVSLENFVLSLPGLKIADDTGTKIPERRTG